MQAMDDDHARTGMTGGRQEPWTQGSGPGGDGGLRASDAERDQVATELGGHFEAGRLDQAEFDERLTQALRAKTRGELDVLLRDLPAASKRGRLPHDTSPAVAAEPGRPVPRMPVALIPLLVVAAVVLAGALSGGHGPHSPWPFPLLWVAIGAFIWLRRAHGVSGRGGR
jgi:hypothetical protein